MPGSPLNEIQMRPPTPAVALTSLEQKRLVTPDASFSVMFWRWVNLKLMRSCLHYRYRPTSSVLPLCLGGRSAGHGPVEMPEKFLDCLGVPCVISLSQSALSSSSQVLLSPMNSARFASNRGHSKTRWLPVSSAAPQAHVGEGAFLMW